MAEAPIYVFVVRLAGANKDGKPAEYEAWGQVIPQVGSLLEDRGEIRPVVAVHFQVQDAKASAHKPLIKTVVTVGPIQGSLVKSN